MTQIFLTATVYIYYAVVLYVLICHKLTYFSAKFGKDIPTKRGIFYKTLETLHAK